MDCQGDHLHDLLAVRNAMRSDVVSIVPDFNWQSDTRTQLLHLLHDVRLPVPVAKFIFRILDVFYSVPMYVPAPYLYSPLLLAHT